MATQSDGKSNCNFSHFTLSDRLKLLELIKAGSTQSAAAEQLGKSPTSISRELKRNRLFMKNHKKRNPCALVKECKERSLCKNMKCQTMCKNCFYGRNCNSLCSNFTERKCKKLDRYPYVCDGCTDAGTCMLDHYHYAPKEADAHARQLLVVSRQGISLTEDEFARLDKTVTDGTAKGQSIEHIASYANFPVSTRTVRNYINSGITTTVKEETPRGAVFKPRKRTITKTEQRQMRAAKIGRCYEDFLKYANSNPFLFYCQMDTVEGSRAQGDVARLLTFIFPSFRLFLCFHIKDGTFQSVLSMINAIYDALGFEDFKFLFGVLLTDNGSEFSDPAAIETAPGRSELRSNVFFCHPYSSWEKGAIENCHSLLRRIIPKGMTLQYLSRNDTRLINSHINSYRRKEMGMRSPYDIFVSVFGLRGERILKKLHVQKIPPNEVCIAPTLIHPKKD